MDSHLHIQLVKCWLICSLATSQLGGFLIGVEVCNILLYTWLCCPYTSDDGGASVAQISTLGGLPFSAVIK